MMKFESSPLLIMPPAAAVACAFFLCLVIAGLHSLAWAGCALLCGSLAALHAGFSPVWYGKKFFPLHILNFLLCLMVSISLAGVHSLFYSSDTLWAIGPVGISRYGLQKGVLIVCKSNSILLFFLGLLGRAPLSAIGAGLLTLQVPRSLVTLLVLAARHIEALREELFRLQQSAKLRGFAPTLSLHTLKTSAYLAAMLLIRAYDHSLRISDAMKLRGFSGEYPLLLPETYTVSKAALFYIMLYCGVAGILCLSYWS